MNFEATLKHKIAKVDPLKRKEILSHKQAGRPLSEICHFVDLDLLVVSGIIYDHITKTQKTAK